MKQLPISRKLFDLFLFNKWGGNSRKQAALMKKIGRFRMRCGRCGRVFRAASQFLRSCRTCRHELEATAQG